MDTPYMRLLHFLHPIPLPDKTRTEPLQVLALGISRSGTDSLRQALLDLGYQNVYHGFKYGAAGSDSLQWIRLAQAQEAGNKNLLNREEFDRILGDCDCITDMPAVGFAHELLDAYPEAKVILNYREDVDAWARSVEKTVEVVVRERSRGFEWLQTWFQGNLFWQRESYWWVWSRYFRGDFRRHGTDWYREHYRGLEERLKASGRGYLKWKVQDGWEPLCEFLGKEVPGDGRQFPSGNMPEDFMKRSLGIRRMWVRRARWNMGIFGAGVVAIIGGVMAHYFCR